MKKILLVVIAVVLFTVGCSGRIKVYIDSGLETTGIDVWNQNVKYVELEGFWHEDVRILDYTDVTNINPSILGTTMPENRTGKDQTILIYFNHCNVIAHEFGHFLGYEHSENPDSIMYPYADLDRSLTNYKEF